MFSLSQPKISLGSILETNSALEKNLKWDEGKIELKTGIKQRYISNTSENTQSLAIQAVKKIPASELQNISLIISVTNTPSSVFPSIAHYVHSEIETLCNTLCIGLNSGCSGFVEAVIIANNFLTAGDAEKVLIVTADTYSKSIDQGNASIRTLFSDGASAVILEKSLVDLAIHSRTTNTKKATEKHLCMTKDSNDDLSIFVNGPQVLTFAVGTVLPNIQKIISNDEEYLMLPHQAGRLVLDTFKTKIPKNVKILENYQTFGNLVSTSIPNLICENFQKFQESKNIILSGFGVGLAHSSIVLKRS